MLAEFSLEVSSILLVETFRVVVTGFVRFSSPVLCKKTKGKKESGLE